METEESVVDRLAELARCGTGSATALAFICGAPAWSRCVRVRGHDGDCVLGLSEMERGKLAGEDGEWFGYLKSEGELRLKQRRAEEAFGT